VVYVADLAEARAKAREPSVLFVSNHVELHACKVTAVAFEDDPPGGTRSQALPYYAERSVPLWFRVEDVRALSYDQTMTTDWFTSCQHKRCWHSVVLHGPSIAWAS